MNKRMKDRSQSGQALVLFALFLVGLLAVLALVLDGGNLYLRRRRMQNAADAGALAGVRVLAVNGTNAAAIAAAQNYACTRNGATTCDVTISGSGLTVIAHSSVATTFARVLGIMAMPIQARAVAMFGPISETGGAAPIAIRDFNYQFGSTYTIWDDNKDMDPTTGNIAGSGRGWLTLDCVYPSNCTNAGASTLTGWMNNGYSGITRIDSWILGDNGTKASVITSASVGQLLTIVVYDQIQEKYSARNYYHAVHFAAFRVTAVIKGSTKGISGTFEYYVKPGPPNPGGQDGGYRTFTLSQ
jgi:hypothetical protein